jgi:hypothetical protein
MKDGEDVLAGKAVPPIVASGGSLLEFMAYESKPDTSIDSS